MIVFLRQTEIFTGERPLRLLHVAPEECLRRELAALPHVDGAGLQIAFLVVGSGLCGSIYVVCPPMLGEFTPVSQRGAVMAIYGAIYTLAGIIAPNVMGKVVQDAGSVLDGYLQGFTINAVILVISGLLGLLLLWPNTERARLMARQEEAAPEFA